MRNTLLLLKLSKQFLRVLSLKFGLSEKHKKFEKIFLMVFDKSADLLCKRQNNEEDFLKLCVLLKKFEL